MQFMANGRSALIIIAGLWLCLAGPAGAQQAEPDGTANTASDPNTESATDAPMVLGKPVKHRAKKAVAAQSPQPAKLAAKPAIGSKKTDDAQPSRDDPPAGSIPSSVSNAKAQFGAGGMPGDGASRTMSPQPDNMSRMARPINPADASAANPDDSASASQPGDQPSDGDRTVSPGSPSRERPPAVLATAAMQTPYSASNVDSTWGRTSLIGKIFVALGGLLTLASAARMFIA
jgi:hypothetical protein